MSVLTIKNRWIDVSGEAPNELTATHGRLQLSIGKRNITEHKTLRGKPEPALEIPLYYLAEWIAENWWVLLYEPRKDEESDDSEYFKRHSIVAAQEGFPLPDLSIMPFGRAFRLNCNPREVPFASIRFIAGAFADAPREDVEGVLKTFIRSTVERLEACGISETALAVAWKEFSSLTTEEREFCEMAGSLGLAPSDVSEDLSSAIIRLHDLLGSRATRDFCLAATKEEVHSSIGGADAVIKFLPQVDDTQLSRLLNVTLPADNYYAPSWRRGMQAAKNVRESLGINVKDSLGADKLFEALHIDPSLRADTLSNDDGVLPFSGLIDRNEKVAKVALLQTEEPRRRFGAGRAAYLAWVSERQSRRLVTNAVTRDQQASRQFAAEILIPQAYLKSLAGSAGALHYDQVRETARQRRVMPDVAFKQAHNAGIRVAAI